MLPSMKNVYGKLMVLPRPVYLLKVILGSTVRLGVFFNKPEKNLYLMLTGLSTNTSLQPALNGIMDKAHSPNNCTRNKKAHGKNVFKGVTHTVPYA